MLLLLINCALIVGDGMSTCCLGYYCLSRNETIPLHLLPCCCFAIMVFLTIVFRKKDISTVLNI